MNWPKATWPWRKRRWMRSEGTRFSFPHPFPLLFQRSLGLKEHSPRPEECPPRLAECPPGLAECPPRLAECPPRLAEWPPKLGGHSARLGEWCKTIQPMPQVLRSIP
jgi:hypothetical protein